MEPSLCICGCGTTIPPGTTYVRGHHWRVLRDQQGIADTRTCEGCGREYRRDEIGSRQSNRHWSQRRFCSDACRRDAARARFGELRGEQHPGWKGDEATRQAGRKRARSLYSDAQPCQVCGASAERHHRDGDTLNNEPGNIAWLCRTHHIRVEDRMAYRRGSRGGTAPPRNPERRALIVQLASEGMKQKDIAAKLGISQAAVSTYLSRHRRDTEGPA